jgi:4-amino-4-deoxy-L-arabinose transferase-like glycosyltransferase
MILAAYPTALWFDSRSGRRDSAWLPILLALALFVAALTGIMFWEGLLGLPFSALGVAVPYVGLMLPGLSWWQRARPAISLRVPPDRAARFTLMLLALIAAAILFNAAYFPFSRDDTLGIYHPQAVEMTARRGLIPLTGADSLYLTYPAAIPLTYTFAYLASGWHNEYLARIIPALMSIGCIPAAYVLAKTVGGERAGWWSAAILALTPLYARWASSGYVDLPMAFSYTLAAIYALRLWRYGSMMDAILAGGLIGLAAWTKNAALLGVAFLTIWLLWCWIMRRVPARLIVVSLIACAAIGAAWYIRNLAGAGFAIPATAWTERAGRTVENLLVFVLHPENFALSGWLIALGTVATVIVTIRRRAPEYLLLLLWSIPFFAAWWAFASYDPRFLLLFLPVLSVMAGLWAAKMWARVSQRQIARYALAALALALTLWIVWQTVEFKDEIARDPLMSDGDKRALVRGS